MKKAPPANGGRGFLVMGSRNYGVGVIGTV
jgi:hypothetical protein